MTDTKTIKNTETETEKLGLTADTAVLSSKEGKLFEGVVVKSAMKDTATVSVERYVKHPKYKKYMKLTKKFLVHDVGNTKAVGEKVVIKETRPISKRKRFIMADSVAATK